MQSQSQLKRQNSTIKSPENQHCSPSQFYRQSSLSAASDIYSTPQIISGKQKIINNNMSKQLAIQAPKDLMDLKMESSFKRIDADNELEFQKPHVRTSLQANEPLRAF